MNSRRAIRLFVNLKAGTTDLFINGIPIAHLGQQASERLPAGKYYVRIQPYPNDGNFCILSNLWIGPWTGELSRAGNAAETATALTNGDTTSGTPKSFHDGKLTMDGDIGAFDIPTEKVQEVNFGGSAQVVNSAGRIRFADGTLVNVDQFQWDGRELTAHSATLGDLRLPIGTVSELIYVPRPFHPPMDPVVQPMAKKDFDIPVAAPALLR